MAQQGDDLPPLPGPIREWFARTAARVGRASGNSWAFTTAVAITLLWAGTGPFFGYSDTWLLIINTITTIVTFLMVFIIQNSQNRDTKAIHLKLDAIIAGSRGPDNYLIDAEDLTKGELVILEAYFRRLARKSKRDDTQAGDVVHNARELMRDLRRTTRKP